MSTGVLDRRRADDRGAVIEPRLRARRIEVARDHGRRRLRRVVAATMVLVVVVAAVGLAMSPLADVDRVVVEGAAGETAQVAAAAGVAEGDQLVTLDGGAVEARVETLPWVAEAAVVRTWSGTVTITVTPRTPVVTVGGDAVLVDAEGAVIGGAPAGIDLPHLAGPAPAAGEQVSGRAADALAVVAGLPAVLRSEVETASASGGSVALVLSDGIEVRWGDGRQPGPKAEALAVLLADIDRSVVEVIDVSSPRATTVSSTPGE